MKPKCHAFFIFLLFVFLLECSTSARLLSPKEGAEEIEGTKALAGPFTEMKEDLSTLMGSAECDGRDEDCLKRRMIAEAHLDYIYTQHNKP